MLTTPCEVMKEIIRNRIKNDLRLAEPVTVNGNREHGVTVYIHHPPLLIPNDNENCVLEIKKILEELGFKDGLVVTQPR